MQPGLEPYLAGRIRRRRVGLGKVEPAEEGGPEMSKFMHTLDPHDNPVQYDGYDGDYTDEPDPVNE